MELYGELAALMESRESTPAFQGTGVQVTLVAGNCRLQFPASTRVRSIYRGCIELADDVERGPDRIQNVRTAAVVKSRSC